MSEVSAQHTPGPWRVERNAADSLWLICCDESPRNQGYVASVASTNDDELENTHLIAAAPETAAEPDRLKQSNAELLEVLRKLEPLITVHYERTAHMPNNPFKAQLTAIRAAIAKAEENHR